MILRPECLSGAHDTLKERLQHIPDLAPASSCRHAEGNRVLSPEHRTISVVVDRNELRSPEQNDLCLRRQQDADRAAQALRPALDRAERRARPVFRTDEGAHLTATYQPVCCQRPRRFQHGIVIVGRTSTRWDALPRSYARQYCMVYSVEKGNVQLRLTSVAVLELEVR